jgi:hypothetical protein
MPNDPKLSDEPQWTARRADDARREVIYIRHPLWYDSVCAAASFFGTTLERVNVEPLRRSIAQTAKAIKVIRWEDGGVRQELAIEATCHKILSHALTMLRTDEISIRTLRAIQPTMTKKHRMCAMCFKAVLDAKKSGTVIDVVSKDIFIKRPVGPPVTKRVAKPRAKAKPAARKRR